MKLSRRGRVRWIAAVLALLVFTTGAVQATTPGVLVEERLVLHTIDGTYVVLPGSRVLMFPMAVEPEPITYEARLSFYNPKLLGTNCHPANIVNGECTTKLLGLPWQAWIDKGVACPPEIPLKTRLRIPHYGVRQCVDRGGAIQRLPEAFGGHIFIDLLQESPPLSPNGTIVRDYFSPSGADVVTVEVIE